MKILSFLCYFQSLIVKFSTNVCYVLYPFKFRFMHHEKFCNFFHNEFYIRLLKSNYESWESKPKILPEINPELLRIGLLMKENLELTLKESYN